MTLLVFIVSTAVFAATLWSSIRLVDGYNSTNTMAAAVLIGAAMTFSAMAGGAFFMLLPLVAMLYLLTTFYDISIVRSILVVVVQAAMHLALDKILSRLLG